VAVSPPRPEKPAPRRRAAPDGPEPRHILITQCLQNDLFLDPECRLWIGDDALRRLLVAKDDYEHYQPDGDPRRIPPDLLENGPLGLFLHACVGRRFTGEQEGLLHVINIRDWHRPDDSYDAERRMYGRHCEANTWGAQYLDGLEKYLDPADPLPLPDGRAAYHSEGNARIYHVHSDSVFDFRPRWDERHGSGGKFHASTLERLLDVLVTGGDQQIDALASALQDDAEVEENVEGRAARRQSQALRQLALDAVSANEASTTAQLYVAVIGVYTDIKVPVLLAGIRARYEVQNLAVSDTLTASKSLERHLHGLDFADKLLSTEVVHGLGDLCSFLGTDPPLPDESGVVGGENYSQYRTYFSDKQNVLAYESEKRQEYARLTERRAIGVYNTVKRANVFLLVFGSLFLCVSLIGTFLNLVDPGRFSWQLTLATGGVGLVGLVAAFFNRPMRDLQKNLNNLAAFRMVLESHSLKTAFTRYHLTTPEVLRELKGADDFGLAKVQIDSLRTQLDVIDRFQASDYEALERAVGFAPETANGDGAAGTKVPAAEAESAPKA
jgi:hypothetical protein